MIEKYLFLKEYPLVRLFSLLLLAFLLGLNIPFGIHSKLVLLISVLSLLFVFYTRFNFSAARLRMMSRLSSILLYCSIFCLTYLRSQYASSLSQPQHYSMQTSEMEQLAKLEILQDPIAKSKSYQILACYEGILEQDRSKSAKGKIMIYLEASEEIGQLKQGDIILAKLSLQDIAERANPEEFNYKEFLKRKGIYHWAYCKKEDWQLYQKAAPWHLSNFISKQRSRIIYLLKERLNEAKVQAVALALIVGEKNELSYDLRNQYAHSGAMHVLAVSGLHLGVLYLALSYLLRFLRAKKFQIIKLLLLLGALWFYAFLTGSSPSVLRAACMFSLLALATSFQRKTQILNILAASALILLYIQPMLLYEVGFQLSYLALLGILAFHSKIYALLYFDNFLLDKIWGLVAVSLAAQLTSTPISLYYFHVFPNYFILSNLLIVPLAIFSVYTGFILILLSPIKFLSIYIAKLLSFSIKSMNYLVEKIDACPYSLSEGISLELYECILLYLFVLMVYLSMQVKRKEFLFASLVLVLCFLVQREVKHWKNLQAVHLCVYKIPKQSAIEIQVGNTSYQLFDEQLRQDKETLDFKLGNFWIKQGIEHPIELAPEQELHLFRIVNKNILVLDTFALQTKEILALDYLIITAYKALDLQKLSSTFPAKLYLFDSSLPTYTINYWKKECESLNLNCYFVSENQAFVEKLN
ncbi:MAG: ComEC/Rec2 family competence protein [Chitinophagales bacterium]